MRVATRLGPALAVVLGSRSAGATEITVDCPRVEGETTAELRARARLTLDAHGGAAVRSVTIRCQGEAVWIDWRAVDVERLPVDTSAGLVEGSLRAIEGRLAEERAPLEGASLDRGPREPAAAPTPKEAPLAPRPAPRAAPPGEGAPTTPAARPARRPDLPRAIVGGLALGAAIAPHPDGVGFGPALLLGLGWRDVVGLLSEGVIVDPVASTLLVTPRLGIGWGAPWVAHHRLGAAACCGVDGLSALGPASAAEGHRTDATPLLGAGLRVAWSRRPTAAWIGLDASYRFAQLRVSEPHTATLPRATMALVGGVALRR